LEDTLLSVFLVGEALAAAVFGESMLKYLEGLSLGLVLNVIAQATGAEMSSIKELSELTSR
jgi:hypothetical protein